MLSSWGLCPYLTKEERGQLANDLTKKVESEQILVEESKMRWRITGKYVYLPVPPRREEALILPYGRTVAEWKEIYGERL